MPSQFDNPSNPWVHRNTTALEVLQDTGGRLDAFVAGVGTGGTVTGVGKMVRAALGEGVLVVAVEPSGLSRPLGRRPGPHKIQRLGAGFVPENYDASVVDRVMQVTYEDSCDAPAGSRARRASSRASPPEASSAPPCRWPGNWVRGKRVVSIVCDTGERYLSTPLFPYEEPPVVDPG